ncbi:retention module-containing protein [Shewanella canadensis]|nr:retention module-containing protein [Shewanella canadensis]
MGVSIAKQDAVVTNLVGQLKAKDEQGNVRDVTIGDLIKNGEQLIFSSSAQFILEMADGSVVDETNIISEEPSLAPTPEEELATAPVSTDAEIAALQAQILAGEDPTAGLPETAAGTAAGAGGNEGTDFITLDRTADETIAGSGYDTSGFDLATAAAVDEPIIAEENILPTLTSSSITLSETNLPQGSSPLASALSQANTITLAAPNGISLLVINGVEVFTSGVFAGLTSITSASGTLNITGYDAATGILSYSYTLNSAVDHSAADIQADTFNLSLTDILGNNTTSTITANLLDDAPSGQDDSGNIGEDDVSVSGSVIINDTQGADSSTVSQITNSDGASLAVAQPTSISGNFGALQISADGSYSYLLSTQLDAVQSLAQGEQVTDTFIYQLTDSDGDSVPVTLTLTITGTNDTPVITTEIGDGADQGTVIESGNEDDGTIVPGIPQTTGTLTATDIDNGAILSWSGTATGTFGSFVIDAVTGQWTYTLDNQLVDSFAENSATQEEFLVTVTDEFGASATQLVTITINGTNDSPIITSSAADAAGSVNEQPAEGVVLDSDTQTATGTLTAGDVDTGAVLSWSGDADSLYGSFSIDPVTGEWTYTLDNQAAEILAEGEVVQESFLVTVIDEFGATDTQTVTINITGKDEATVIANDSNTIDEGSVALGNVLDNDSDDDDQLTVSSFTVEGNSYSADTSVDLENGTLVLNSDGTYVFTPDTNWNGNVPIITYTTNTGATATLTIVVEPVNDAPDAFNNSYSLNEGGFTSGNIITDNTGSGVDSDIDGGALNITHINGVAVTFIGGTAIIPIGDGTLTINQNGSFTYDHNGEEPSPTSFTYTINDGLGGTDTASVFFNINPVNDGPFAEDDSFSVDEGALLAGNVITHIDNNDGLQDSDGGDGGILNVTQVNGVDLVFNLGWSQDIAVGNGTLRIQANGTFEYQHNGSDPEEVPPTFQYTLSDGAGTATAVVTITTNAVNDGPFAEDDSFSVDEGALLGGNVITHIDNNDTLQDSDGGDGGILNVTLVNGIDLIFGLDGWSQDFVVGNGTLRIQADGTFEYQHDGTDPEETPPTFEYTLSDNTGTDTAVVTITTNAVNDGPFAEDDSFSVDEGALLGGNVITHIDNNDTLQDSDGGDGGILNVTQVNGVDLVFGLDGWSQNFIVGNGTLRIQADGTFEYQHDGTDPEETPPTFEYTLSDGTGTDTAVVTITTNAVNDGPFAEDDSFSVDEGALLGGNVITHIDNNDTLQDSDGGDGGILNITQVNGIDLVFGLDGWSQDFIVGNGTLRIQADGTFEYQHDGTDPEETPPTFEYTLSDGTGTDTAVVTIATNAVNDGPFAEDDSFSVDEGALLGGNVITHIDNNDTLQDSDGGDGGILNVTQVNGIDLIFGLDGWSQDFVVGNGTLRIQADGTFEYQHDGSDPEVTPPTFEYTLSDGTGTDTAVVTIATDPINDGPEIISIDLAAVSEEGLLYGIKDGQVPPNDTTDAVSFVGTLSFTDVDSNSFAISIDDTDIGQYYSGEALIHWNWSGNTLTGTAGSVTVMTIVFATVSGAAPDFSVNYTVTLFAPVDHDPDSNIEDVLPLAFTVTVDDQNGGSADTTLTLNIEDDSPVDDVDTQAIQTITNTIGQYITGDLFSPGADGFGGVNFNVATQGLLYNGIVLTYTMFGNTLKAMAHDTEVFTLTAVPDGNGHYDYKLILLQEIQLEYVIGYKLNDAPAGNNAAYYVDVDGEVYAKDDLATQVIATITGTGSVNSNSHGIGIGPKTSVDAGEDINFYYGINGTSVAAISLGTGNNGSHDGTSYITYVINYVGGGQQTFTNILVDGTFTIEVGPLNGFNIQSINIAHMNGEEFQVIEVSSAGGITEQPIDIDFTYTAIDADGDSVFDPDGEPGGFTVVVEPDTGDDDINILAGTDAEDTLLGGIESDYIIGGTGDDTISGGAGADILIGSEGSDTIDAGVDSDRDAIIWEVGSADESIDTIYNFNPVYDVLNLSDVLVNESPGDLEDFLSFNFVGGSTEIVLDTNGTSSAGGDTLTILLDGVDLSTIYGPSPTEIINGLLDDDALIVDVP